MTGYPLKRLQEEVAFLAYHLHWDHETLMNLDHRERQRWCTEVSSINTKMNEDKGDQVSLEQLL